ncbi:MAG: hypothetical protein KDD04_04370 [Sinomicrobium sp.]|nr:hypothetical protein [Sinomicrobium sp.]
MRALLATAFWAVLLLVSCNNVEDLREPIESLATKWENTTASVLEFVNKLQATQTDLQDQFAKMTIPEGLGLDEENLENVDNLKEGYQEQLAGLSDLSQTVNEFVGQWQEKATMLSQLRDGLAAGSLGIDAADTLKDLQDTVSDAEGALEEWQGDMEDIEENTSSIFSEFSALIANAQGN